MDATCSNDLKHFKVPELKSILKQHGKKLKGKKDELVCAVYTLVELERNKNGAQAASPVVESNSTENVQAKPSKRSITDVEASSSTSENQKKDNPQKRSN